MKTAYVIDIDATAYNDQYYEINYPAEVYETEAEALAALEAYDINNCCDCIVNGDADDILKVWVSVARCDYDSEDIDGELDAASMLTPLPMPKSRRAKARL